MPVDQTRAPVAPKDVLGRLPASRWPAPEQEPLPDLGVRAVSLGRSVSW